MELEVVFLHRRQHLEQPAVLTDGALAVLQFQLQLLHGEELKRARPGLTTMNFELVIDHFSEVAHRHLGPPDINTIQSSSSPWPGVGAELHLEGDGRQVSHAHQDVGQLAQLQMGLGLQIVQVAPKDAAKAVVIGVS